MANGTTRLALSRMQMDGKQNGQHEYMEEINLEKTEDHVGGIPGKQRKIALKQATKNNHSIK